jgi:hypothetical protein
VGALIFVRYILKQSAITLDILMSDEFVDRFMGQWAPLLVPDTCQ